MQPLNRSAGETLRMFRQNRGMTLEQACLLLNTSIPVLSRKERNEASISRDDIKLAIVAYDLDAWEAYQLWSTTDYIPEITHWPRGSFDLHQLAASILPYLYFPAFITDEYTYVRAWNHAIETIWAPSLADNRSLHLLDDLFSLRVRERMGPAWETYILRALRIFRQKTLLVRDHDKYGQLMHELTEHHGDLFLSRWEASQDAGNLPAGEAVSSDIVIIEHGSAVSPIQYVVTSVTWQIPQPYDVSVYVPFGEHNVRLFHELSGTFGPAGTDVYFPE